MRVTNSMLVSNFMNNLNTNMTKLDKLQGQMTNGKKFTHLSDDPVALIYSQQANYKIDRLEHYKTNVETAKDWVMFAEESVMDLNKLVTSAYELTIDTATDIKTGYDKINSSQVFLQLRDQLLQTMNSTIGEKYLFGGYNTVGQTGSDGKNIPPFELRADGKLYYDNLCIDDLDLLNSADKAKYDQFCADVLTFDVGVGASLPVTINGLDLVVYGTQNEYEFELPDGTSMSLSDNYYLNHDVSDKVNTILSDIASLNYEISEYDTKTNNALADYKAAEAIEPKDAVQVKDAEDKYALYMSYSDKSKELRLKREDFVSELSKITDVDTTGGDTDGAPFELTIGSNLMVSGDTVNGTITSSVTAERPKTIFGLLNDLYTAVNTTTTGPDGEQVGISADKLERFIPELQAAQSYLLAWTADLGGRDNRLDIMLARYEQDYVSYVQMLSDAEDADYSEVIMNYKMAEAVYKAALSSGASIIQPTLMDYLR